MRKNVSTRMFPSLRSELIIHQNPLLPVTVQDQIRLWELEKNRLKSSEGEILQKFGWYRRADQRFYSS